jgi:transcriptional regulator with XRE-family HTH domain
MKIGSILRKLRNQKKFSQSEVADKIGVCQSTYFAWENDKSFPNAKHYVNIAVVFEISLNELIPQNNVHFQSSTESESTNHIIKSKKSEEEILSLQKQVISLQLHRINQLETENRQLCQQTEHLKLLLANKSMNS